MKLLFDFFPILLFFIAYRIYDIYVATAVAIAATLLQVGFSWFKFRKLEPMHLVTLAITVIFGGLTLYLHDETFIKWKPTIINWLFGIVFLASHWIGKKTMAERMFGKNFNPPKDLWNRLNILWILFFLVLGGLNLFVMYSFDTSTWVNFKLFGMLGLTLAFFIPQIFYLSRYLLEELRQE